MQALIKYPAFGQEAYWKRAEDQTRFCYITVQTPDSLSYRVKVTEGTPQWTAKAGEAIDIEIKDAPTDGKAGFAYIAGQAPAKKFGNSQPYQRREFKRPTKEEAAAAADYITDLFHAIKGRLKDAEDMAIAALTVATYNKTC